MPENAVAPVHLSRLRERLSRAARRVRGWEQSAAPVPTRVADAARPLPRAGEAYGGAARFNLL